MPKWLEMTAADSLVQSRKYQSPVGEILNSFISGTVRKY